jgi:hypothetical protein
MMRDMLLRAVVLEHMLFMAWDGNDVWRAGALLRCRLQYELGCSLRCAGLLRGDVAARNMLLSCSAR